MMKIRDVLIGFVVSAIVVGIAVSCGGGGGSSGPSGPATYTVSGALSGATGTIVLKLNGGSDAIRTDVRNTRCVRVRRSAEPIGSVRKGLAGIPSAVVC